MSCRASFHARVLSYLAIPECKPRRGSAGGAACYDYDMRPIHAFGILLVAAQALFAQGDGSSSAPPPTPREFRAVWVATVANIDWPSKPGLSTWDQQRELIAILDRAQSLRMNAVIFQVRPGADAMYASPYEPWARFLTGRQGRAPEPPWDPLAFAVEQAHQRGMELHAWFNPYRAAYARDSLPARTHISKTNPGLVRSYGTFLWMDPGDPEVRRRSLRAIVDVVKRYDVDGVHIDDYFYPYPETDGGKKIDFPDSATYARYLKAGGKLAKDDWRRDNVNKLVEALYKGVHAAKPQVRVGISPFGIWRPGFPPSVKGFDAYAEIYADSKKWLQNGWADYVVPQLYWPIRRAGAAVSGAVRLVALTEHEEAPHVARARDVSRRRDERAAHHGAGDRRRDRLDARTRRRSGACALQYVGAHEEPRQPRRQAGRSVRRAGARSSVSLARCDSALEADGDARTRCRDRRVRADAHAEAGREGVALDRSDEREWCLDDRSAPRLARCTVYHSRASTRSM